MRELLRNKRIELNLTPSQIAKQANITPRYYNYIENGERSGSVEVLKKISKILGISDINYF